MMPTTVCCLCDRYEVVAVLVLASSSLALQSFTSQPANLTARLGQNLSLPCQVAERAGAVQWTRDSFGLGVNTSLPGFPRYRLAAASQDFSLSITAVRQAVQAVLGSPTSCVLCCVSL